MHCFQSLLLILIFSFSWACSGNNSPQYAITVTGDELSISPRIISFSLPQDLKAESYALEDPQGKTFPLQLDEKNEAWAVLPVGTSTAKGFSIVPGEDNGAVAITIEKTEGMITFLKNDQPIISYQTTGTLPDVAIDAAFLRGGYIHPVYTPKGKVITDDYPESHRHHHGIWAAWTKTVFEGRSPDFWNMGDKTGKVSFKEVDAIFEGAVMGGFSAVHQYVDTSLPESKVVLEETWDVQVYNINNESQPYFVFDLHIKQQCASSSPLILPAYRYGGVGFRGHGNWNGEDNAYFLTSEGKDRSNGHGTSANWCHIGGYVDHELAGIAIMGHPENFRAPQPMRIHPTEPFFNFAPSQAGDWSIRPDEAYLAKYRFVVYDGPPDTLLLQSLWKDYAQPLKVMLGQLKD